MKRIIIAIFFIVAILGVFGIFISIYSVVVDKEPQFSITEVEEIVSNKQHAEVYLYASTPNSSTKTQTLFQHYLVKLNYDSIYQTFDNQTLYESVKKGDIIYVQLCQEYDENGTLINQYLAL